jgi:hypothetical protein
MAVSGSGTGRSRLVEDSTDPVVVGLGRLLVGVGVLALLGTLMAALWILSGCGAG